MVFDAAVTGFLSVFHWPAIGYLFFGIMLGLYFGAVPGLSGLVGMAILLPFTFTMDPVSAFSFLLGMYAVTTTSDTISSVLLGVPGTAASQATILDGYPLAMKGQAARAFGAAFTCSAVGGVLGAIVLAISIPIVRPLVLSFGSPEFFMLGVVALTMVGSLSGNSVLKGLAAAAIGLFLSTVGYAEQIAIPRYWLGSTYLIDGLSLVPLVLGLFALPELTSLAIHDTSISQVPRDQAPGLMMGVRDALDNWWLLLRSTAIGVYIGLLPGLGGPVADWVAYGHVVQTSRDKSQFGKGDIRGVIGPEAANNSVKGGELIPTIAFGIPGSAPMAILLGAFLIQGLTPGPLMLTTKLDVTFSMVATLIVANVVGALLLMVWANQLAKVTFVKGHLIIPAIVLFVLMGAWMSGNVVGDWYLLLAMGAVGILMKYAGWPRPPLVLGFILGPIMENALSISLRSYGPAFLLRPICLILEVLVVVTVGYSFFKFVRNRRSGTTTTALKGSPAVPAVALPFAAGALALFSYAIEQTFGWPHAVALMPLVAAVPGFALSLVALIQDGRAFRLVRGGAVAAATVTGEETRKTVYFFLWLLGIVGVTILAGQMVALPLFIFLYLLIWGKYSWWIGAIYAAAGFLFLYFMFDRIIHVLWYPSFLF